MYYTPTPQGYLLRLKKGEEITSSLVSFCAEQHIQSGFFHGLGAVSQAEIGYYNLEKKEYVFKTFEGDKEIVSLTGNITMAEGKPFVHMHTILSDENFVCIGGHLKEGIVGVTCEIYFVNFQKEITREFDNEVGLKLLKCEFTV